MCKYSRIGTKTLNKTLTSMLNLRETMVKPNLCKHIISPPPQKKNSG